MREIKYRVWDSYQSKMYSWYEICKMDAAGSLTLTNLLNGFTKHLKPYAFTGLKDKKEKGKEIYHKDLFEPITGSPRIVEWVKDGWFVCWDAYKVRLIDYLLGNPRQETIGNVHQNPELL